MIWCTTIEKARPGVSFCFREGGEVAEVCIPLDSGPNKGHGKIVNRSSAARARGLKHTLLRTTAQDSGRLGVRRLLECRQQGYRRLL